MYGYIFGSLSRLGVAREGQFASAITYLGPFRWRTSRSLVCSLLLWTLPRSLRCASEMSSTRKLFGFLPRVRWFNLGVLTITPAIGIYGLRTTPLLPQTLLWSILYYVISMLGKCVPLGFVRCPP